MQQLINDLDRELLENRRFDRGLFEELSARQIELGISHAGKPICPFLRPYFLQRSRYLEIRKAAGILTQAFERLAAAALEDASISAKLGLSEKEVRWARLEPGYAAASVNSRLDTFLSADGFKFLEYNGENPAGVGDQPALHSLLEMVPEVNAFLAANDHHRPQPQEALLNALDNAYREFGGKEAMPQIAIVDWKGVATGAEFEILREFFESRGYPSAICSPEEIEYSGGKLRAGDFNIDIFYKRVIIHEFLERYDETHALYHAIRDGSVCMVNSFRSKIAHKKSSFAVLSDPAYGRLFTEEQQRTIAEHIPWTRVVADEKTSFRGEQVGLFELLRSRRELFALKPNDDYGGHGISLGWESTEQEWDDAIETALRSPYVAQERVPVEMTEIPAFEDGEARMAKLLVDFDPFLFRGHVDGGMVRLSSNSLVNITQGGGETGLVVLNDF
ncbi:MAG: hypothetical protein QUS14_08515 [Pyrinomonadaceae bacterium]|nr:hypothetical protein [Pyrinomonadaceae bacterium]